MKYAQVVDGRIVGAPMDFTGFTPIQAFPADIAAQWIECPADADARWTHDGENWSAPVEPVDPGIDIIAYTKAKRYTIETGGIIVAGASVSTTRDSQAMITGAYNFAKENPDATFSFAADSGSVELTAAGMIALAQAVGAHVQACFAAQAAILADIESGDVTSIEDVDDHSAWPAL